MQRLLICCFLLLIGDEIFAQNVGVGSTFPQAKLHVRSNNSEVVLFENSNTLDTGVTTAIYLGQNAQGGGYSYTGAIKTIGKNFNEARLGIYTFASFNSAGLKERLTILDDGKVGIGNINPAYNLDVTGNLRATNGIYSESYLNALGNATIVGNLTVGGQVVGSLDVQSNVTVNNGLGIVATNSAARMKIVTMTATLSVSNLAPDVLLGATGTISIAPGTFSGTPTAYLGNVTGENGEYYRATIILENVTATSITIRIFNGSAQPISFTNASWKVLVVGPY